MNDTCQCGYKAYSAAAWVAHCAKCPRASIVAIYGRPRLTVFTNEKAPGESGAGTQGTCQPHSTRQGGVRA